MEVSMREVACYCDKGKGWITKLPCLTCKGTGKVTPSGEVSLIQTLTVLDQLRGAQFELREEDK